MREKEVSNWAKRTLHAVTPKKVLHAVAIAGIVAASFVAKDKAAASVNSEVGSLATEPILLIFDPSQFDSLQYKPWNLGRVWPGVETSPEFFVRALDRNNIPDKLLLTTMVETDGLAKICAYNYPETTTCHEVLASKPDKSYYLFDTGVLDPGKVYGEIGSTRLRVLDSQGTFTITMKLTDEAAKGLVASESTTLEVARVFREYIPYVPKGYKFSSN